jgi:HlyD family secretion protein
MLMKKLLVLVLLLAVLGAGGWYYWQGTQKTAFEFRTAKIERGDLMVIIGATGVVEPMEVVDVGAQVAGRITGFGTDPKDPAKVIDYNTEVEEGTVLARIDESLYAADVAQNAAQLEQDRANVKKAEADLGQMKAKLVQAENNWKRAQDLGPSRALAATEYDSYAAAYETAKATVAVGEATILQAQKAVARSEALLNRANTNLDYCVIKSPVKGKIIDRRVNIGQTVVSSLNAPSLFLIGKDLTRMQVWVAVNEADIGNIHPGQAVTFTVDAFPGRVFKGVVGKIRLNATMTQNVVTYTVEIDTDNSDGKLLPYLTANVSFQVEQRRNVLKVPNAALRWTPDPAQVAEEFREQYSASRQRGPGGGPGGGRPGGGSPDAAHAGRAGAAPTSQPDPTAAAKRQGHYPGKDTGPGPHPEGGKAGAPAPNQGQVWVRDGNFVKPVKVAVGPSDLAMTEILTDSLKEGDEIVIGDVELASGDNAANPFVPQMMRRRPGGG